MKANKWICIAWEKLPSREPKCTELHCKGKALTEAAALKLFKRHYPELRNHTVQPA